MDTLRAEPRRSTNRGKGFWGRDMAKRTGNALSAVLAMAFVLAGIYAQAESHVRIIRLSYIDGTVEMDRAVGQGMEKAILNTPVTEGVRLATGNDGLAEVEFENNSTIRLGENSEIQFTRLLSDDNGAKVNEVQLLRGTAYFDTKGSKEDIYRATAGNSVFLVHRDTQLRLSDNDGNATASVLKGEVELENQQHEVKVGKKETLTVDPGSASGYEIAKGVDAAPLDRWNDERSAYQQSYSYNNPGVSSGLNSYGYADLNYYGGWSNLPGVGYGWQPYGVSNWLGWNPYMAGAWAFYPGFGYTWASAYPWGWLPYHYGNWTYLGGGGGWFWVPGGGGAYRNNGWYSNGFQPAPVVHGPAGWAAPTRPTAPSSGVSSYAPTVRVGTIGTMPPVIPGGRMPPNFRSVVPTSATSRAADRAMTLPGHSAAPYNPATAGKTTKSAVGADTHATYGQYAGSNAHPSLNAGQHSGHVFAPPPRSVSPGISAEGMGGGYGVGGHPGAAPGMGGGPALSGSHAMGPSGGHAGGGGSHSSGGHGSPK